jgi:hypothetical protein
MVESNCDSLSQNAYFFAQHLPQCFGYIDALFEYALELNPCTAFRSHHRFSINCAFCRCVGISGMSQDDTLAAEIIFIRVRQHTIL